MKNSLILALSLFSFFLVQAQNNPDFYVAPNGVTCMCPNSNFGDTGTLTINGQTNIYTKRSRAQLDALIAADQNDPQIALTCTSGISDMSYLFQAKDIFNQDINTWDVSNVTDMRQTFSFATSFNQPIGNWDVSNVTDMSNMFNNAQLFNKPLDDWDVSNVTDMRQTFSFATSFNQPIGNWDVSNVTDMSNMFNNAQLFNKSLDDWDVSNVTNMEYMFFSAFAFNQPIGNWNVSNVTDMNQMFRLSTNFNQPIGDWNVSNVTNMVEMFSGAGSFNQALNNWDMSNVTNIIMMFFEAVNFNQPLNDWDVSNIDNMFGLFWEASSFNQPIDNWDVSNVTNMSNMFNNASTFNQALNSWDTLNVTNLQTMFSEAISFNKPLNNWDVSNVTDFQGMFLAALSFNQDLSNWNFNNNFFNLFLYLSGLDSLNYDLFLNRINELGFDNGTLSADGLKYCDGFTRQALINKGWFIIDAGVADECDLNYILGSVFFDEFDDGCDSDDPKILDLMINIDNGTSVVSYSIDSDGAFKIPLNSGNYTVSITEIDDEFAQLPLSQNINFTGQNEILENIDFCITANQQFEDLSIDIFPLEDAIPGFETDYQVIVSNNGTQTVSNVQVTIGYDESFQTYISSTVPTSGTATDLLTFQFTDLEPFSQEVFEITLLNVVPPTLNSGDILSFTTSVTPDANDTTPYDNTVIYDQTVVNSFDPNDKMVVQGDEIIDEDIDQYLDYRIRFQNLGTANALNVKITDTIDNNLDWTTFQPITSSHDYRIEIVDGEQINYYFDNINLPFETADPEGSNGYITYKIKPKPSVQIGDTFENTAYIYFDFNLPIITNTVVTTVVDNLDVNAFDFSRIDIYPNPVNDRLNISLPADLQLNSIDLFDIQGKQTKVFKDQDELDFSDIAKGVYILKLDTDKGVYNHKIIRE